MAIRAPFRRSGERLRAKLLPPEVQHRPASLAGRSCRASTASPRRNRATKPERVTWARSGGREEIGRESVGERVEGGRAGLERGGFTSTGGARVHAGGAVGGCAAFLASRPDPSSARASCSTRLHGHSTPSGAASPASRSRAEIEPQHSKGSPGHVRGVGRKSVGNRSVSAWRAGGRAWNAGDSRARVGYACTRAERSVGAWGAARGRNQVRAIGRTCGGTALP